MASRRIVAPSWLRACVFFFLAAGPYVPATVATTETAKLTAANGVAGDDFGISVSMSGDTMVIGAPFHDVAPGSNQGSAYIFVRSAGTWMQQARLTASDGVAGDAFGVSVAVTGDTVVVGAFGDDSSRGAAYVFAKPGGGWINMTQTAKLTASDGASFDDFGWAVAVSGDTVVVGALFDNSQRGSAYVFVKPAGGWINMTHTAKLTASDAAAGDGLGFSVGLSGDTAVVGAWQDDVGANADQGSAYVFVKPGGGWTNMTQTAKLTTSDGAAGDSFGPVAVSGDTVVGGAWGTDPDSAYVFVKPGVGWSNMTQTAKLAPSDAPGGSFGFSVGLSGNTVVVGANGDISEGAAYLFIKPGGAWINMTETDKLTASDGASGDEFGYSIAVSAGNVVIGARSDDIGPNGNQGSAYVFDATIAPVNPPLAAPAQHDRTKNRYVSFAPNNTGEVAFQISKTTAPAGTAWVGAPDPNGLSQAVTALVTRVWSEPVVHVGDCEIVPIATFEIRATADSGNTFSSPLTVNTIAQPSPKFWADTVGSLVGSEWTAPNGVVNVNDYLAALQKFLGVATAPHVSVVDVQSVSSTDPCLNRVANIADVFLIIKAFQGNVYPFETNPANCPPCP